MSLDQALLYLVDLRLQVRGNSAARDIVDRCLALLTAGRTADAERSAAWKPRSRICDASSRPGWASPDA